MPQSPGMVECEMGQLSTALWMLCRVPWLLGLSELREREVEGSRATFHHGRRGATGLQIESDYLEPKQA